MSPNLCVLVIDKSDHRCQGAFIADYGEEIIIDIQSIAKNSWFTKCRVDEYFRIFRAEIESLIGTSR